MDVQQAKICLIGSKDAGKSSLALRFVKNRFDKNIEASIGAAYMSTILDMENFFLKCHIWDTAGEEKFKSLTKSYYRGIVGAVLVYDITKSNDSEDARLWYNELKKYGHPHFEIAVAANKHDLKNNRKISKEAGVCFAKSIGGLFCETSALPGYKVNDMFTSLFKKIPTKFLIDDRIGSFSINNIQSFEIDEEKEEEKESKCC